MDTNTLGQKIKSTTRRILRLLLILFLVIGIAVFSFYYWGEYDKGVQAGKVIRISKKGIIFKTYEGKLNLETFGALKGVSPIAESFDFSVEAGENDQIIKDLEKAAASGERVNLRYIKRYAAFPWRGDTKFFVVAVETAQ